MGVDELERSLAALLAADGKTEIVGLRRLSGGASRETWSFDAVADGEGRGLILQRLRPGVTESSSGIPMSVEAEALRSAGDHGVPVARVVAVDDAAVLGSDGRVVERRDGVTHARPLLSDDEYAPTRPVRGTSAGRKGVRSGKDSS